MSNIQLSLEYKWEPFKVDGQHPNFFQHKKTRLERGLCSHWGAVIYKWEGILRDGPNTGMIGILIGETADLRQRIKQYVSGTQKSGNVYWRENFLERGDIYLYIMKPQAINLTTDDTNRKMLACQNLSSGNRRVAFEQLLIMHEVEQNQQNVWMVNRKL